MDGLNVTDCFKINAKTETSGKSAITKLMKEKGYFPAAVPDGKKWYYSKSNPYWVLRHKQRRLFVRVQAGQGGTHYLSAILVPTHHPDLDAFMEKETEAGNRNE